MRFPSGAYLENLTLRPDGAVLFTNYFAKEIGLWSEGRSSVFATLDHHPVNLLVVPDGVLLLTHGRLFTEFPAALAGSNRLHWLDRSGAVTRSLDVPDLIFGNGMVADGNEAVLVSDAAAGLIRRVDLATGRAEIWFDDPVLKPDPGQPKGRLGVNGLKRDGSDVLFTNSASRRLYRLALRDGRPAAQPRLLAETEGADDIAVATSGTIYLATHRETVLAIREGADSVVVADADVLGSTAVALSPDERTLYVLGSGGLFEGKTETATLVRVILPR